MSMESAEASGPRITKASKFRAKYLKLVDGVADSGEEIVITKNGQPVSRRLPYWEKSRSPFGRDLDHVPNQPSCNLSSKPHKKAPLLRAGPFALPEMLFYGSGRSTG